MFDKNAGFIWAAYGMGAVSVLVTAVLVVLAARRARARMIRLEAGEK
jgi:heme exporter protein CcmD